MKTLLRFIVLFLLVAGLLAVWEQIRGSDWLARFRRDDSQTTQTVVLQQVTALGKIELVRYTFKDIVEHERIRPPLLPNAHAILIVEGEATGCIDLTRLTAADIRPGADTIVVRLPQPELCGWKINHDRSRVYDTQYGFMDESALVSDAFRRAEGQIRRSALNSGILDQTRQNAERILRPVLERISGKRVVLTYQPATTSLRPLR